MIVAWAVAAALMAQAPAPEGSVPQRLEPHPCKDLPAEARCGVFSVPENRGKASGRRLALEVVVLPARAAKAREPVFILSGGPGQPATDSVSGYVDAWERDAHDVVFVDLRGTGRTTGLDCDFGQGLQAAVEPMFGEGRDFAACRRTLEDRADLTQYTTPIAMQDLDEVRRALGYDKINLEAGSYGTRAALVYLRSFGGNVRSAFLSGAAPFANRAPLYHAAAAQRAFDRVVAQCEAQAPCKARYPRIREDLTTVRARLRAQPARVAVKHPETGDTGEILLSDAAFGDGLRVMLYSVESGRRIPRLLELARAGDYAPFAQAALSNGYGLRDALRLGLTLSVSCPEDVVRIAPAEVARETGDSFVGDYRVRGQMAACAAWPVSAVPADYAQPFVSRVPALIVSGDLDPVTPPTWGEQLAGYFSESAHLVGNGAHVADSDCVAAAARKLFDTGRAMGLDVSCAAQAPLPPFPLAP